MRDDLVARVLLDDPDLLTRLTGVPVEGGPGGAVVVSRTGTPPAGRRIIRVSPNVALAPQSAIDRLHRLVAPARVGGVLDSGTLTSAFLDVMTDSDGIAGADLWTAHAGVVRARRKGTRLGYGIEIDMDPEGSQLSLSLDP